MRDLSPETYVLNPHTVAPVLYPRAGRSPWRCIYQRIGDVFVIGAIAPEAQKDKAGFERAVGAAKSRLAEIEP